MSQKCASCRFWYNGDMDARHPDNHRGDYGSCTAPIPACVGGAAFRGMWNEEGKSCRAWKSNHGKMLTYEEYKRGGR